MKTRPSTLYYSSCPVKQLAFPIYIPYTIQAGSLQLSYLTRGLWLSQWVKYILQRKQNGMKETRVCWNWCLNQSCINLSKCQMFFYCCHISRATSDQIWVNDNENILILTNTKDEKLNHLQDVCDDDFFAGVHTVDFANNLIYINTDYNLKKLSTNMKRPTTFLKSRSSTWKPCCLHWSKRTASLLVRMNMEKYPSPGKITRYNQNGEVTQTIEYNSTNQELLYNKPRYITENNNGDVVVSDHFYAYGAVVVTDHGGRHRFTYQELDPGGICTDSLSNILVCDFWLQQC